MLHDTPDIAHLTQVISHATAPAFLLGSVAGYLSILITRLERVIDRSREAEATAGRSEEAAAMLSALFTRRIVLLNHAIYLAVLSALSTAALLIVAFVCAFFAVQHERGVAVLFVLALALLMGSLTQLTREVRVALRAMRLK